MKKQRGESKIVAQHDLCHTFIMSKLTDFRNHLLNGSPPLIVASVFAAIAWWITHTVDRMVSEPVVEYDIVVEKSPCPEGTQGDCKQLRLELENLSSKLFENLELEIQFQGGNNRFVGAPKPKTGPPTWGPRSMEFGNDALQILYAQLHPGAHASLTVQYLGTDNPILMLKNSPEAIRLTKPNFETYFVKHENCLIALGVATFTAFAMFVLFGVGVWSLSAMVLVYFLLFLLIGST